MRFGIRTLFVLMLFVSVSLCVYRWYRRPYIVCHTMEYLYDDGRYELINFAVIKRSPVGFLDYKLDYDRTWSSSHRGDTRRGRTIIGRRFTDEWYWSYAEEVENPMWNPPLKL